MGGKVLSTKQCPNCKGRGLIIVHENTKNGKPVYASVLCPHCRGTGRVKEG